MECRSCPAECCTPVRMSARGPVILFILCILSPSPIRDGKRLMGRVRKSTEDRIYGMDGMVREFGPESWSADLVLPNAAPRSG